jgi:beta-barrel assembly-enhancing protease
MDSDEINAFAAPGGFILVSRGLLRCCRTEDEVAAILAHEIAHVSGKHGLKAIETGRLTSALTIIATEAAKNAGSRELAELTKTFEGSITDITGTMVNNGYAYGLEYDADASAVATLKAAGYDPCALKVVLEQMKQRLKPGGLDFAKTHPEPKDRVAALAKVLSATPQPQPPVPAERQRRYAKALADI